MTDLAACSTAIGALAALLRTGFTTREALVRWSAQAPESLRPDLERLRRRLLLGETVESAVLGLGEALGDDAASVATVLAVHARLGGDAGRMLDRLAQAIEVRRAGLESARAAAAGATLSARLVASLPFAFVPLAPLARAPLFDAVGLALLGLGISLGAMGMVWMSRLVPRPPLSEDGAALVADLAATVLAEGASVPQAFDLISRHAPPGLAIPLGRARRIAALGATWPQALQRTGESELDALATTVGWAQRSGLPVARALEQLAARRRGELAIAFDRCVRRGPVLMVLPLVTCVLPSFLLLGLAPFLRTLSVG